MSTLSDDDILRLNAYLDDELDPGERAALQAELSERPELRDELEGLKRTLELVSSAPELPPPPDFDRAVQRRIRRRSRGRYFGRDERRERLAHVAIPLAALAVLALIAFLLHPGRLEILMEDPATTESEAPAEDPEQPAEDPSPDDAPETGPAPAPPSLREDGDADPDAAASPAHAPRRIVFRYVVRVAGEPDEVERELRRRFGGRSVSPAEADDDPGASAEDAPAARFVVRVERGQVGPALQRLEDLGRIERFRVEVAEEGRRVPVLIRVEPRP